jgi:hypothetical protein
MPITRNTPLPPKAMPDLAGAAFPVFSGEPAFASLAREAEEAAGMVLALVGCGAPLAEAARTALEAEGDPYGVAVGVVRAAGGARGVYRVINDLRPNVRQWRLLDRAILQETGRSGLDRILDALTVRVRASLATELATPTDLLALRGQGGVVRGMAAVGVLIPSKRLREVLDGVREDLPRAWVTMLLPMAARLRQGLNLPGAEPVALATFMGVHAQWLADLGLKPKDAKPKVGSVSILEGVAETAIRSLALGREPSSFERGTRAIRLPGTPWAASPTLQDVRAAHGGEWLFKDSGFDSAELIFGAVASLTNLTRKLGVEGHPGFAKALVEAAEAIPVDWAAVMEEGPHALMRKLDLGRRLESEDLNRWMAQGRLIRVAVRACRCLPDAEARPLLERIVALKGGGESYGYTVLTERFEDAQERVADGIRHGSGWEGRRAMLAAFHAKGPLPPAIGAALWSRVDRGKTPKAIAEAMSALVRRGDPATQAAVANRIVADLPRLCRRLRLLSPESVRATRQWLETTDATSSRSSGLATNAALRFPDGTRVELARIVQSTSPTRSDPDALAKLAVLAKRSVRWPARNLLLTVRAVCGCRTLPAAPKLAVLKAVRDLMLADWGEGDAPGRQAMVKAEEALGGTLARLAEVRVSGAEHPSMLFEALDGDLEAAAEAVRAARRTLMADKTRQETIDGLFLTWAREALAMFACRHGGEPLAMAGLLRDVGIVVTLPEGMGAGGRPPGLKNLGQIGVSLAPPWPDEAEAGSQGS